MSFSSCFWLQANLENPNLSNDERILKITGQNMFLLSAIRRNSKEISKNFNQVGYLKTKSKHIFQILIVHWFIQQNQ